MVTVTISLGVSMSEAKRLAEEYKELVKLEESDPSAYICYEMGQYIRAIKNIVQKTNETLEALQKDRDGALFLSILKLIEVIATSLERNMEFHCIRLVKKYISKPEQQQTST